MKIIIHKHIDSLETILPRWETLREEFQEVTVFQDINWIKSWWWYKIKHHPDISPYIIEIKDDHNTVGIIPLYRTPIRFARFNFYILKPMGSELSDYLIPILSKKYSEEELLNLTIKKMNEDKDSWHCLEWGDVPEKSALARYFKENKKFNNIIVEEKFGDPCPFLQTNKIEFEDITNKFNKRLIKEILYKDRKLRREGNLSFLIVQDEKEIEPIMNKFFDLHCERWKDTDTPSKFRRVEERNHALLAAKNLFKSNLLYLTYMSLDEEIIVVNFGMNDGKRNYLYLHSINVKYKKYSPGSLFLYYLIKDACNKKCEMVDFLRGDEGYKENWGTSETFNLKYKIYNHSIKSLLYRFLLKIYKNKSVGQFLEKLSVILSYIGGYKKINSKKTI